MPEDKARIKNALTSICTGPGTAWPFARFWAEGGLATSHKYDSQPTGKLQKRKRLSVSVLKKVNAISLATVVLCALVYYGANCRLASVVHADGSGQPVAYVPINITNTQSIATPSPIQVMIIVNSAEYATYEAADLSNVAFTYSNTTLIPSWLESGNSNSSTTTVYWLKVDGIPAKSSMTVLMSFYPVTDNVLNNVSTGEAPSLSPTYGEYDNGANVFILYGDFNNSLSGWQASTYKGSFMPALSPNGIKMLNGSRSEATYLAPPKGLPPTPIEIEEAWDYNGVADAHAISIGPSPFETSNTLVASEAAGAPVLNNSVSAIFDYYSVYTHLDDFMTGSRVSSSSFSGQGNFSVVSFLIIDGTSASAGYSTQYVSLESFGSALVPSVVSGQVSGPVSNSALIISGSNGDLTSVQYVRWVIARAFPPNGVVPSVTVGNVVVVPEFPSVVPMLLPMAMTLLLSAAVVYRRRKPVKD